MREQRYGCASLHVFDTRDEMGLAAAADAGEALRRMLADGGELNVVFAAAPSQSEMLRALVAQDGIDWGRVHAFHMDEYVGLRLGDSKSFGVFLSEAVFDRLPFKSVNLIDGGADPAVESLRYAELLRGHPVDVVFMGIGENGHLAFNDPPVADFDDPLLVKVVELEEVCRRQQVNDGCFPDLGAVPRRALTLTIPVLVSARRAFCVVPGGRKARALRDALVGEVTVACPASVMQRMEGVVVYADEDAAGLL